MNKLILLKNCKKASDLASLLGYSTKKFSYILFNKASRSTAYTSFEIPKKNGGKRTILSPNKDLKKLQRSLTLLLNDCFNIIEKERLENTSFTKCILSHGFRPKFKVEIPKSHSNREVLKIHDLKLGIYSNAYKHKNKNFVLNIDLKDFFTSITFNRIVGYFCKNDFFKLNKQISILIAQIATYRPSSFGEAFLPQGSPCSPIISNLIAGILDNRLNNFAQKYNCTYTRYADDLSFSTNQLDFPLALYDTNNKVIGKKLLKIITDSWFEINVKKTRLTHKQNRQEVTGLIVNKKVNVSNDYYRYSRCMVHNYCKTSIYKKSKFHNKQDNIEVNAITGVVNHIFNIKKNEYAKSLNFREYNSLDSIEKFYIDFHFHKECVHNLKPYIICEGITDPLHLKNAYKNLNMNPSIFKIKSIEEIKSLNNVMGLSNGVGPMIKFLIEYSKIYKSKVKNPIACIFLVDGDSDGNNFIKSVRDFYKQNTQLDFPNYRDLSSNLLETYHITNNIFTTQLPNGKCIEDIYDPTVLKMKLNNRSYNKSNKSFDLLKFYGKTDLINKVIKPANKSIDFSQFNTIFDTIHHIQTYNYLINSI
ncbi:retron Ec67 family RNA-directed DNA polymerase/endonuclease [Acinetobacter beijerinckii]|uniref:retron Ec67 family RNA-directed DNA polymerase/endonuclease n=1 Tax=Acinetobacter beijerinckii TaxID=262668 RepID=UPI003AF50952